MSFRNKTHIPDQSDERLRARPPKVTGFAELDDGSLLETIEDPQEPGHNLLVFWREGRAEYDDEIGALDQDFVPLQPEDDLSRRIRLPQGVKPYGSTELLLTLVEGLFARCFTIDPAYMRALTSFVLYTWLADRLPVACYLSIVGPPSSGKTTILETLSLVCRRSLFVDNLNSAEFHKACERYSPTLFIDDIDCYRGQSIQAFRRSLRAGTTPTHRMFGPKVMSSQEPLDDTALDSRCIVIPTREVNDSRLIKAADPSLESKVREIQMRLLCFRLEKYREIQPAVVQGAEQLRPRDRDLFGCLAAPFSCDELTCQSILSFFKSVYNQQKFTTFTPQAAVITALYGLIHMRRIPIVIGVGDLTKMARCVFAEWGGGFPLTPRKVGAILTSLAVGFRVRTSVGYHLYLDGVSVEQIHAQANLLGIEAKVRDEKNTCPTCNRDKETSQMQARKSGKKQKQRKRLKKRRRR